MNTRQQPVLIAAGGTGGHMFPAVSLASALSARGHSILFVTDPRGGLVTSDVLGLPKTVMRHTISARSLGGGPKGMAAGVKALAACPLRAQGSSPDPEMRPRSRH